MNEFNNNEIRKILLNSRVVAVVGVSDKPERDSSLVAGYLMQKGYKIIPVNPKLTEWRGLKSYPSLLEIPKNIHVDVVDVFRKSEFVGPIVIEAGKIGAKVIWFQEGVINEDAALRAQGLGMKVVMDRCMMKEVNKLNK